MSRDRSTHRTLLAVLAIFTGCAEGPGPDPATLVRDSAGVRIVETDPDVWPPPEVWRVPEAPTVEIGVRGGDPDYELFQVRGALGLPDGGTVVAEFGARLTYYDARGAHVRTLDREGQGPGEAEAFMDLRRHRGDSLLVVTLLMQSNVSRTEMLVLDTDGSYGRDVTAEYPGLMSSGGGVTWLSQRGSGVPAVLADGSLVVEGATRIALEGSAGDVLPGQGALMRLTADGILVDTVATVRTGTYEYRPLMPRGFELMLAEADPPPARPHGLRFVRTSAERFLVDVYEARPLEPGSGAPRSRPSARRVASFRVHAPLQPSTDASRETYMAAVIEVFGGEGEDARQEYRDRMESLRSPDSIPALQDLRVDRAGNLWTELYRPPGRSARSTARERGIPLERGPSPWVVLDPDGRVVGSVLLPEGLEVFEIGEDYVLGMHTDELGIQRIRRHAVLKDDHPNS